MEGVRDEDRDFVLDGVVGRQCHVVGVAGVGELPAGRARADGFQDLVTVSRPRSYNQMLWMLDPLKGATYPPS